MAKFISKAAAHILQDAAEINAKSKELVHKEPWAEFVDHVFETTDEKVIERLRGLADEGISEAPDDEAPAATPAQ